MIRKSVKNSTLISICIQIFNRHDTVVELFEHMPKRSDIEVLVYDFSTENETAQKNAAFFQNNPRVQYERLSNRGLDCGFDLLARNAISEYCWLLPDDDLIEARNIDKIISALVKNSPDFLLLNSDVYTVDYRTLIKQSMHKVGSDLEPIDECNFPVVSQTLSYVGSCIFRRSMWKRYAREKYYCSFFMHVFVFGEIVNNRGRVFVTNIKGTHIRANNALWTKQAFTIWTVKWPEALKSIDLAHQSILELETLSSLRSCVKHIVYYYAYGALLDKKFAREVLNDRCYRIYFLLRMFPRTSVAYLLLLFMVVKHKSVYNEPCYYLLSSIKTNIGNKILRKIFR